MKILFVRPTTLLTISGKSHTFQRMKVYQLPKIYAEQLIREGYACEFGFFSELGGDK